MTTVGQSFLEGVSYGSLGQYFSHQQLPYTSKVEGLWGNHGGPQHGHNETPRHVV